jgi:hypothetical protein
MIILSTKRTQKNKNWKTVVTQDGPSKPPSGFVSLKDSFTHHYIAAQKKIKNWFMKIS